MNIKVSRYLENENHHPLIMHRNSKTDKNICPDLLELIKFEKIRIPDTPSGFPKRKMQTSQAEDANILFYQIIDQIYRKLIGQLLFFVVINTLELLINYFLIIS